MFLFDGCCGSSKVGSVTYDQCRECIREQLGQWHISCLRIGHRCPSLVSFSVVLGHLCWRCNERGRRSVLNPLFAPHNNARMFLSEVIVMAGSFISRVPRAKKKAGFLLEILPAYLVLQPVEDQHPPMPQPPTGLGGAGNPSLVSGPAMDDRETLIRTFSAISRVTTLSVRRVIVP